MLAENQAVIDDVAILLGDHIQGEFVECYVTALVTTARTSNSGTAVNHDGVSLQTMSALYIRIRILL